MMNRTATALTTRTLLLAASLCAASHLSACGNRTPTDDPAMLSAGERRDIAESHWRGAEAAFNAKRYDDAIAGYERGLKVFNDSFGAWNNLGMAYMEKGKLMEAAQCFRAAADLDRADPRALANLGALWQRQQYWDEAAKYYEQALERNPNFLPALLNSVVVDNMRDHRTEATANRIRQALLLTDDPVWREYLLRQKQVVDGRLADPKVGR